MTRELFLKKIVAVYGAQIIVLGLNSLNLFPHKISVKQVKNYQCDSKPGFLLSELYQ